MKELFNVFKNLFYTGPVKEVPPGYRHCPICDGTGNYDSFIDCATCDGQGYVIGNGKPPAKEVFSHTFYW